MLLPGAEVQHRHDTYDAHGCPCASRRKVTKSAGKHTKRKRWPEWTHAAGIGFGAGRVAPTARHETVGIRTDFGSYFIVNFRPQTRMPIFWPSTRGIISNNVHGAVVLLRTAIVIQFDRLVMWKTDLHPHTNIFVRIYTEKLPSFSNKQTSKCYTVLHLCLQHTECNS